MQPIPTLRDVADATGVSVATVSMVLRGVGRISPETRARVHAKAAEMGYRRDPRAVALREGRSRLVAIVMAAYRDAAEARAFSAYWSDAVNECALGLAERGYAVVLVPPNHIDILERVAVDLALVADAVVDDGIAEQLRALGIPLASGVDGSGPGIHIEHDSEGMMGAAMRWLRAQGCARLLMLARTEGAVVSDANVAAFTRACAEAGQDFVVERCGFSAEDVTAAYERGLAQGCDGVLSMVAGQSALTGFAQAGGLMLPGTLPTVFYEDVRAVPSPAVAVLTVSPESLGRVSAQAVADYLDSSRTAESRVRLPFSLLTV
ncbi:MAG: LacI family transcriptional regulator [Actinomycetales bacterium]|nr:LacI family transcriptional regulator [Actinomycetales bacterium]